MTSGRSRETLQEQEELDTDHQDRAERQRVRRVRRITVE